MAEAGLNLEPEVREALDCITRGQNFLVSGGAGSGKTYSLVQTITRFLAKWPSSNVACITYTNAAVAQVEARIRHSNVHVSTIHDFLWAGIKHYQKELKSALVQLVNDPEVAAIRYGADEKIEGEFFDACVDGIQYKEYARIAEGIISHDEVIVVSEFLFREHPKLCGVIQDRFQLILVDEYQDTDKAVVSILLDHFKANARKCVVGFFGDAMQSIYRDRIGNLDAYKGGGVDLVHEIKKVQNRRNPTKVIDLANRLRNDGIIQVPSRDANAPNMCAGQPKVGSVRFLYSHLPDIGIVRSYLKRALNWDFSDSLETKELNLTHNLIAEKAGFKQLMEIYDKDRILELKGKVVKALKEANCSLEEVKTFGDAVDRSGVKITTVTKTFIADNPELFRKARNYSFAAFMKVYADKDQLLDDKKQNPDDEAKKGSKRDALVRHLYRIQRNIALYRDGQFNSFLKATDFPIRNLRDKRDLKEKIDELTVGLNGKLIADVIKLADETGICRRDDSLNRFNSESEYLYDRVVEIPFCEFQRLYDYLEGNTPFSTQHKTKGDEYDNVLVILDNGRWNDYNFDYLFLESGTASVLERTRKIFYVCCTRSKESLAVYFHEPSGVVIEKAKEWFGADNVVDLDHC